MATTYNDIISTLKEYFNDNWVDGGSPRTPVAWPNVKFESQGLPAWVRMYVRHSESGRQLITGEIASGQVFRGLIFVDVFIPANTSTEVSDTLMDHVRDLWNEKRVEISPGKVIICLVPEPDEIGDDGKGWYQSQMRIPFEFLES